MNTLIPKQSLPTKFSRCASPLRLAALACLLAGCAVGPDYQHPRTAVPAQWSAPIAGGPTNLAPSIASWWKTFNDPQLDSLIERAVKANLDLKIAGARVREARAQYRIVSADLWPTVGVGSSYARQNQSKNQPIIGSLNVPSSVPFENNVYQAGFDASWEIDVFGGTRRAVEAGKAEVAAAEFGRRNVLLTLLGEVAPGLHNLVAHPRAGKQPEVPGRLPGEAVVELGDELGREEGAFDADGLEAHDMAPHGICATGCGTIGLNLIVYIECISPWR